MPKIKLTRGELYYKTIPIYEGVQRIDKVAALEDLKCLKTILDSCGVEFQLSAGTLLGAIREKDFIDHDEDIDLIVLAEQKQQLFDALPQMIAENFKIARYDRRGLLSIIRGRLYIDFYFFEKWKEGIRYCSGMVYPEELVVETMDYNFKGVNVKIPKEYVNVLRYEYGDDWMTPVKWFDYESSFIKKLLVRIKSQVKEILPDKLYFYLVRSSERKLYYRYLPKLNKYRTERGEEIVNFVI